MKKNIIIPIVAALVAVVVAVSAAVVVKDLTDGNIWHRASAIRDNCMNTDSYNTIFVVDSLDELNRLCRSDNNHYGQHATREKCYTCGVLDKYNNSFFKRKSLILVLCGVPSSGNLMAIDRIFIENNTLFLNMYEVTGGFDAAVSQYTVFIEVKKSDIEEITDNQLTIEEISPSDFPANLESIIPEDEKELYR